VEYIETTDIPTLIDMLEHRDYYVQMNARNALVKLGEAAIEPVYQALLTCDPDYRYQYTQVLVEFGEPAVPIILRLLEHPDNYLANLGVQMLGDIGSSEALDALITLFESKGNDNDWQVLYAIQKIDDIRVLEFAFNELLKVDSEYRSQCSQVVSTTLQRLFEESMKHPHALELMSLLTSFVYIYFNEGEANAYQWLGQQQFEENPLLSKWKWWLAGFNPNPSNIEAVLSLPDTDSIDEQMHRIRLIRQMHDYLVDHLDSSHDLIRLQVVGDLSSYMDTTVPLEVIIKRYLTDENQRVREQAVLTLGYIGNDAAIEPILNSLLHSLMSESLYHASIQALKLLNLEKIIAILEPLIDKSDSTLQPKIRKILEGLNHPSLQVYIERLDN